MRAPVLGFLGTGEQLGGAGGTARLLPRLVKGLAAIPQLGAAPKAQPLKAWHKAHLIFLSPVSVLFEAVHLLLGFFFFPQPSPVPPWLRGDSNNNTPSAAMTRAQKALAALRRPWARHPSSSDTAWEKVQPPEDVWQRTGALGMLPRSPVLGRAVPALSIPLPGLLPQQERLRGSGQDVPVNAMVFKLWDLPIFIPQPPAAQRWESTTSNKASQAACFVF